MSKLQIGLGLVLAVFGFESAWAVYHFGYLGVFEAILATFPGQLVLFDLVIALSLVMVWMWRDARQRGASVWPYLLLTGTLGSVGPLLYLIRRDGALRREAAAHPAAARLAQPA